MKLTEDNIKEKLFEIFEDHWEANKTSGFDMKDSRKTIDFIYDLVDKEFNEA